MKIALLSQSYPPMVSGAAIVVKGLAEGLAQRGHQVMVLTASEREYAYSLKIPNLVVERLRSSRNPLRVGQRFATWPYPQIVLALRAFHPDVIHSHDPLHFGWSALSYGSHAGIPVVLTAHQLPWFVKGYLSDHDKIGAMVEQSLWAYSRLLLNRFSAVITPTRTIAEAVSAQTGIESQVIGFGVDPEIFRPGPLNPHDEAAWRARLGIPDRAPVLLHVGRFDRDKRVDLAIRAAALAMQRNRAHLLLVGDGTEKVSLMNLCAELGIANRAHFPGFIPLQEGLPDVYRLASLFFTASEVETQGLVLLEAAACGLPLVAFRATCIPEIVRHGVNGLLVLPRDVKGLAAQLRTLLDDPDRARLMGQAGRLIAQGMTLRDTLEAHESLYRQVTAPSRQPVLSPG